MWDTDTDTVMVAIGDEPVDAVLELAAFEALRDGSRLHLVHVVAPWGRGAPDAGPDVLRHAADRLRELVGDRVLVSTELSHGPVVPMLVAASELARLVVVGHDLTGPGPWPAGRVAASAKAPVVVVPTTDRSLDPHSGDQLAVTVGVDTFEGGEPLVRRAVEECRRRGTRLRLVHAWDEPVVDDTAADWDTLVAQAVEASYAELLAPHPWLAREVLVVRGPAAPALVRLSVDSGLLVVGRHKPCWPGRLGPTAAAVVHGAHCAVLVVPSHADRAAVLP